MSDTIIAIDLGRYNSVAWVYHRATRARRAHSVPGGAADRALLARPGRVGLGRTNWSN
jgi:hypothetical protein